MGAKLPFTSVDCTEDMQYYTLVVVPLCNSQVGSPQQCQIMNSNCRTYILLPDVGHNIYSVNTAAFLNR